MDERIDPRQRIAELEQQIADLIQQVQILRQSVATDWHSAMFAALNLILKPYRFNLTIEREHLLNTMPTRIDCLIVKIDKRLPIEMDAFRLFRKYNVIELKSYQDELNEDVIWHAIGYAATYKSLEEHVGDIPSNEITITIIRSSFPRALLKSLKEDGWHIEEPYHNIFYLNRGIIPPIQIVVTKDLGDEYIALQILTGRAKENDVRKFAQFRAQLTEKMDVAYANAVLWACSEANEELFRKMKEDEVMGAVLMEIMRDKLDEAEQKGAADTLNAVAERLIQTGSDGTLIATATGYDRNRINKIARRLNRTVTWNEARL